MPHPPAMTSATSPARRKPRRSAGSPASTQSQFGFKRAEMQNAVKISGQITGRDLTGPQDGQVHANLSAREARKLIDTLEGIKDREELIAHLAAGQKDELPVEDPPDWPEGEAQ